MANRQSLKIPRLRHRLHSTPDFEKTISDVWSVQNQSVTKLTSAR